LVSNCKCAIDIANTRGVGIVLQHCNFAGRAGAIRSSTLRATRVAHCTFTAMYIFRANLLHSEVAACAFVDCYWEDVELSFSQLIDSTLTDCRVRNLRLDGSGVRTLHLSNTRVLHLSAAFSDIFDIEVVGGVFGASFDRTLIRSLMLWRVRAQLSMKESRVFGLRLCAVDGIVGGSDTTWWLPVIRRSALRGDGTKGITLLDADCTNTQITNDFGIWTKNTGTIDRLDTL